MKRLWPWASYAVLLALALSLGFAAESDERVSSVPRVDNPGPLGLKVLHTYLSEAGFDVRVSADGLFRLTRDVKTVLIPAPTAATLDDADVEALKAFARAGGTVVVLLPRGVDLGALRDFLGVKGLAAVPLDATARDPAGATLTVVHQRGALSGVKRLRVGQGEAMTLARPDAVPLTSPPAVWWLREGRGEVYVATGADLAQNGRLDLEGNAQLWLNLAARGPLWLDESHHVARAGPRATLSLWATLLQLAFVAALFALSSGARLGPPREPPRRVHRSGLEYVEAMARLTQRAGVERELVEALRHEVRLALREHLGLALTLSDAERVRAVGAQLGWPRADAEALFGDPGFLSSSRRVAALEARLAGRSEATRT
ncbi:MAG: DUF4350 domain-containing protein [Myxococcaceae bacterium]|jgi:hypothetical protein|nr:DUF4350 domain-containing protein [Myxococcaceae bacterium]MCA3014593.1 DUF4350 domain-containing protein [Myxococcaceae bacterium]